MFYLITLGVSERVYYKREESTFVLEAVIQQPRRQLKTKRVVREDELIS